jgi:tRNA threonylcarbamoyl adenosine modification protein YjeE
VKRPAKAKPRPKKRAVAKRPKALASETPRVFPGCTQEALKIIAQTLAAKLRGGDRVLIEGEMGTGKTTLARSILEALGQADHAEGSPSFPIAHEYRTPLGDVIHIDFDRLNSEEDIEQAGLLAYFWEREALVLTEWLGRWPALRTAVIAEARRKASRVVEVRLEFVPGSHDLRRVSVSLG